MKPKTARRNHRLYRQFIAPYRVDDGKGFRLKKFDPDDRGGFEAEDTAHDLLAEGVSRMYELQERMFAQDQWALLLIFQAMDAAGKDSTIKHVLSGLNPQGTMVYSFKQPSNEELDHDYLWRCAWRLPERGRIGIFNRSYYEETLVVRVHPEILESQRIPPKLVTKNLWRERYQDIRSFERHLVRNGTVVRKFFLYVSRAEQKRRFLSRLEEPDKNWKFSMADARERAHWKDYMNAYEDAIRNTSTPDSPWFVVPADHKWYTRLVVAAAVVDALEELNLKYPEIDDRKRRELAAAKRALLGERKSRG